MSRFDGLPSSHGDNRHFGPFNGEAFEGTTVVSPGMALAKLLG
jgi:hypothetical protein